MAEIIPSLSREVLNRMQAGEKRFASRLKDLLEDDYLCWFDIPVGPSRRYPDFIVLHPGRGLLFLEVKDWKPDTLKKITPHQAELLLPSGRKTVPNPFEQVRQYTHAAIKKLENDPQLQQQSGQYNGKLVTPYGWGVVFTNITRRQIEQAIPDEAMREKLLPDHLIIYKDEMTEGTDAEAFQERLWNMFPYTFREKLTLPQIDRVRWHLFPEVRIDAMAQESLFDTPQTQEETVASVPDIVRIMDVQQEQLARSLGEGHRVIHGVAGSGKTLILGYRAQLLAETSNKPVLVLCFNITLAAKLRAVMLNKGINGQVEVCHFHDWCKEQLKTYNVDVIEGDAPYWERQVASVIEAVEQGHIPRAQYGALMIDEGHDFEAEWLTLVVQMIDPDSNSLLLLYDDAQSIYKKNRGLGFTLSSVGVQAKGRTTILKLNYRNTREILDFCYRFAAEYMEEATSAASLNDESIPLIKPEAAGTNGESPIVHRCSTWADELDYTVKCLRAWQAQGIAWKDIALIYSAGFQGREIAKRLKTEGIPHLWMGTKEYKQAYDPNKDQVTVLTIQSSKGLEFPTVVMMGVGKLNNKDVSHDVRCLYVGMTRAQQRLMITTSNDSRLTQKLMTLANG